MPEFQWRAAKADGALVQGRATAAMPGEVAMQLRSQGLTPLAVNLGNESPPPEAVSSQVGIVKRGLSILRRTGGQVRKEDVLLLTSELAVMLKAGLALDRALKVLISISERAEVVLLTQTILSEVKAGASLSKVLARHPEQFSDFYVSMVRSGEASGQLAAVLERLTEHLERLRGLRENVISATIYPAILVGVAILSLIVMIGFVVPQFETLFKGLGDALPLPTRAVMFASRAFADYGLALLLCATASVIAARKWLKTAAGQKWLQTRVSQLPWIGGLLLKYELTLYSRTLGTLMGSGVPLVTALPIATQTVGNMQLRVVLYDVIPKVKGGGSMVDALNSSAVFEPLALSLIRVGEETGRTGPMFLELARLYNRDVESGIKRGLTMLEPLLILVLGVIIASIIVSILMGILSINDLAV